jgi:hypothetical protein
MFSCLISVKWERNFELIEGTIVWLGVSVRAPQNSCKRLRGEVRIPFYFYPDDQTKKAACVVFSNQFQWCLAHHLSVIISGFVAILFPSFVLLPNTVHGFQSSVKVYQNGGGKYIPDDVKSRPHSHDSSLFPNFLAGVVRGARDRHVQNWFSTYWLGCQSSMRYQKVPGDMVQTTNNAIFKSIHLLGTL